jgi:hypothetical protein
LGRADPASGMSEVERAQYKSYKELKQRIERERQLAVVQVKVGNRFANSSFGNLKDHSFNRTFSHNVEFL